MLGAHRYYPELIDCDLCGVEAPTGGLKGDARLDWLRFEGWAIFLITWPVGNPAAGYQVIRTLCPDCIEAIRKAHYTL